MLFVWVEVINSFGLDTLAVEIFPLVIAIVMYRSLFACKQVTGGERVDRTTVDGLRTAEPKLLPG